MSESAPLRPTIETSVPERAPVIVTETESAVWTLSAIAPPTKATYISDEGDEAWYIRIIDEYIRETIASGEDLDVLLRDAVETAADLYASQLPPTASPEVEELPSAMCSCLRWDLAADRLDYLTLGDGAIWATGNSPVRICASDGSVYRPDYDPDDQWRLSFSPESLQYARNGSVRASDYTTVGLATGGLDMVVEDCGLFESWRDGIAHAQSESAESLLEHATGLLDQESVRLPRDSARTDLGLTMVQFAR